jgi:hypothetical protein
MDDANRALIERAYPKWTAKDLDDHYIAVSSNIFNGLLNEARSEGRKAADTALSERVAELERGLEWRPIESAPRDGTRVIMWGAGWDGPQTHTWQTAERAEQELAHWHDPPTHWMPLPAHPSEGEAGT